MSIHRLRALHNATKEIGLLRTEAEIADAVARHARAAFSVERSVLLVSSVDDMAVLSAPPGSTSSATETPSIPHASFHVHCLVKNSRALEIKDLGCIAALPLDVYSRYSFAPLEGESEILGVLGISRPPESLTPIDLELFCAMAAMAAAAVQQTRLRQKAVGEEKRRLRLARYFSPQVTRHLLSENAGLEHGVLCDATVLISDIRGFTALSEHRQPAEILGFLNEYFGRMTNLVFEHRGMIDKLMGDGLLAVFGAPTPFPDHAIEALRCAAEMVHAVRSLDLSRFGVPRLRIGVGVHSGPVLLGDLGGESFLDFTVLGPTVNLASRLEALTKTVGGDVVLSDATLRLASACARTQRIGPTEVRGFDTPLVLHRLLAVDDIDLGWNPIPAAGAA